MNFNFSRRLKHSPFSKVGVKSIDYTNVPLLMAALTETQKIRSARVLNTSAAQQRALAKAIKRARNAGFLPYCDKYDEPKLN